MEKDNIRLIDLYLRNELSENEKNDFLEKLDGDNALLEEFNLQKSMHLMLKNEEGKNNLTKQLDLLGQDYFKEEQEGLKQDLNKKEEEIEEEEEQDEAPAKVIPLRRKIYFITAIAAAILFMIFTADPLKKDLFDEFNSHEAMSFTVKGDNESLLQEAELQYNKESYEDAVLTLEQYLNTNEENQRVKLAYGISLMKTQQEEKAITVFKELSNKETFQNAANWYLGLTYVKINNFDLGKSYLEKIPASDPFYFNKAERLLNKF